MTLSEIIELNLLRCKHDGFPVDGCRDAILAAIREHMTSPEAVERAFSQWCKNDGPVIPAFRAAILAALGGEP